MAKRKQYPFPSLEQIRQEMNRTKGRGRFQQALKGKSPVEQSHQVAV